MSYPVLGKAEARAFLSALEAATEGVDRPIPPEPRVTDSGPEEDWDAIGHEVAATLEHLANATGKDGDVGGSGFEAAAGPAIHRLLPEHPALADPEFWVWLALMHCRPVVAWRYPKKTNPKNFGIGGSGENLLYRLWLRAEIAFAPGAGDPYELAYVGDIDFWRSHIFRQGYGEVRHFARALIEFQFPAGDARRARLKIGEIRTLVKQLKRARSNAMFELMTEQRAARFIEAEWERLVSEAA